MKIAHIEVQNFRKLKCCRVELGEKETVFVGANNSGKTSAMDAMILFLKKSRHKEFSTTDFTLSNWTNIDEIATEWVEEVEELNSKKWLEVVPTLDIWLQVEHSEIHYVSHIIPTLDWSGGKLGIRLTFEPKKVEDLYKAYKEAYDAAKQTSESRKNGAALKLWPQTMRDFLDRKLIQYFEVKGYILDPSKIEEPHPQALPEGSEPLDNYPLDGILKIDIINAQRGFSDPKSGDGVNSDRRLSSQLRGYFEKHLNPSEMPEGSDLDALEAIESARTAFDERLKESFKSSISELEGLNYPGFNDPQILISSKVNPVEGLNHDAAVQFNVVHDDAMDLSLCLPEKYNGLGYQNLISMIFNLIRYRDEWMRVGKAGKKKIADFTEPLHLVLIEEPEAHLHAQVQQVFIKKAYSVLRNHPELGEDSHFSTQLAISTHSSHIAHEIDFSSLRYFKRLPANAGQVPCASVVNLSNTFGGKSDTSKFATRYLKTTHCDLFFADGVILVEGPVERMLVPHFIRNKYANLDKSYISLLEIGGSHAHRLRPLIEALGVPTLVITDLDSIEKESTAKALPQRGEGLRTGNETIKTWAPVKVNLDEVLSVDDEEKIKEGTVRVAYQYEMRVNFNSKDVSAIPYTFEDALVLSNISFFKDKSDSKGLIKKMADAVNKSTVTEACQAMFEALGKNSKKAEMALELLYTSEPDQLEVPIYIAEGLDWLQKRLGNSKSDFLNQPGGKGEE